MSELKRQYKQACDDYLKAFCDKHGYDYEPSNMWVGEDAGGVADVSDLYVDMATIRTDIDSNAPRDEFLRWYDYILRICTIDPFSPAPIYDNWLRGCPRKSEEEILELEQLNQKVEDAKRMLQSAIEDGNHE